MSELSDIQENVKEFLTNVDIDFSLPLVETKFQIFEEIKIIYELDYLEVVDLIPCVVVKYGL